MHTPVSCKRRQRANGSASSLQTAMCLLLLPQAARLTDRLGARAARQDDREARNTETLARRFPEPPRISRGSSKAPALKRDPALSRAGNHRTASFIITSKMQLNAARPGSQVTGYLAPKAGRAAPRSGAARAARRSPAPPHGGGQAALCFASPRLSPRPPLSPLPARRLRSPSPSAHTPGT